MSSYPEGVTPERWDEVRQRFKQSMMVKTEIAKLGQNVDLSWPLKGREEVPLKYLPLTLDELLMMPGIGEKPERIRTLIEIFVETMAFDDPFSEMAEHVDSSSKRDDGPRRMLEKREVPLHYPIRFCGLSEETLTFCASEELETLEQFFEFTQNMAQSIVVGGDFRAFLNAIVNPDDARLGAFLPIRRGKTGLHLAEAFAHATQRLSRSERLALLEASNAPVTAEDRREVSRLSPAEFHALQRKLQAHGQALLAWFGPEGSRLRDVFAEGSSSVDRYFAPLDNPQAEKLAAELARLALGENLDSSAPKKKSFFGRLFGG